jgi:hypothetical protein
MYTYSFASDQAYNKYDFGLSFNMGYTYALKRDVELTLQLTNNYGVHQISDWFASFNYPKWYNNSYSILVGIVFSAKAHKSF